MTTSSILLLVDLLTYFFGGMGEEAEPPTPPHLDFDQQKKSSKAVSAGLRAKVKRVDWKNPPGVGGLSWSLKEKEVNAK